MQVTGSRSQRAGHRGHSEAPGKDGHELGDKAKFRKKFWPIPIFLVLRLYECKDISDICQKYKNVITKVEDNAIYISLVH